LNIAVGQRRAFERHARFVVETQTAADKKTVLAVPRNNRRPSVAPLKDCVDGINAKVGSLLGDGVAEETILFEDRLDLGEGV